MTIMTTYMDAQATTIAQPTRDDASLIYRLEGELLEVAPITFSPGNICFESELDARVAAVTTPETMTTRERCVSLDLRGNVVPPAGADMPTPEAMATPGFDYPDLDYRVTGSAFIRTTDPRYAHLDRTVVSIEGWVNFESGELEVQTAPSRA
jgi:hypothetical protein